MLKNSECLCSNKVHFCLKNKKCVLGSSPKAASGFMCFARSRMKLAKAAPPIVPPCCVSGTAEKGKEK